MRRHVFEFWCLCFLLSWCLCCSSRCSASSTCSFGLEMPGLCTRRPAGTPTNTPPSPDPEGSRSRHPSNPATKHCRRCRNLHKEGTDGSHASVQSDRMCRTQLYTEETDVDKRTASDMEHMKQAMLFVSFLTLSWTKTTKVFSKMTSEIPTTFQPTVFFTFGLVSNVGRSIKVPWS